MKLTISLLATGALLISACGGSAKSSETPSEVTVDTEGSAAANAKTDDIRFFSKKDPAADTSAFKTYAWYGIEGAIRDPEGKWSVPELNVAKEIAFLVDRELRGRGMTEVAENPDVLVAYSIVVDMEAQKLLKDEDNNMDIVANVPQNALFVAFADPDTGEVVWVGAASGEMQEDATNDSIKARLDYAVTKILSTVAP